MIKIADNSIFYNDKKISNFIIKKVSENHYELDNGRHKRICEIKFRNLNHFKNQAISEGNYLFEGNTKQMNQILDSLETLGFQEANGNFQFSDTCIEASKKTNKIIMKNQIILTGK